MSIDTVALGGHGEKIILDDEAEKLGAVIGYNYVEDGPYFRMLKTEQQRLELDNLEIKLQLPERFVRDLPHCYSVIKLDGGYDIVIFSALRINNTLRLALNDIKHEGTFYGNAYKYLKKVLSKLS